jgi:hypothetical protein
MKIKRIILGLSTLIMFNNVFAVDASAAVSVKQNNISCVLNAAWLNNAWDLREDLAKQSGYISYMQKMDADKCMPKDYETSWKAARMIYFLGNYGVGEKQFVAGESGVKFFDYGVRLAKQAIKLNPNGVEGQYWYAIDLGSYGLVKGIMASAMNAKSGMKALNFVCAHDSSYHWSGANRTLGKYYSKLPGMFGGDKEKALASLLKATQEVDYSNNWVFLGQYYLEQKDGANAIKACQRALQSPKIDGKYEEKRYTYEAQECIAEAQSLQASK